MLKGNLCTGGGQGILFLGFPPIYIMFVSLRKTATEKIKEKQIFSAFWSSDRNPHFIATWFTEKLLYGQLVTDSYKSIYRPPEQLFISCET